MCVSVTRASGPPFFLLARVFTPSSLILSLSRAPRVSTEVPYVETGGGGKALEFFARILLFRKAFDGVSGSRVIRAI